MNALERGGEFVGDVTRDRFGGWIDAIERMNLVEVAIAPRREDRGEQSLDGVKVAEELFAIKLLATDRDHDAPVVTVQSLPHSTEKNRMRCRELGLDLERERSALDGTSVGGLRGRHWQRV